MVQNRVASPNGKIPQKYHTKAPRNSEISLEFHHVAFLLNAQMNYILTSSIESRKEYIFHMFFFGGDHIRTVIIFIKSNICEINDMFRWIK